MILTSVFCLLASHLAAQPPQGAKQANAEQLARRKAEYLKDHTPRESAGLTPLTDLGKAMYKGEQGGLYPGGENVPRPAHLKAGVKIAKKIAPLDAAGKKAKDGKIVLLSIGFSNPN